MCAPNVVEHLGSADAVLVVDETGDVKKGSASAGVQRQYSGTAGRVENCQVAVFLSYASQCGHALIDRELYLSRAWTGDAVRCAAAGIPAKTAFATKPKLARAMLARALDAGTPAAWVTGDEVYGGDPGLGADLEGRQMSYVLAVAATHRVTIAEPARPASSPAACPPGLAASLRWRGCQGPPRTGRGGRPGAAATSTAPEPATTGGKPGKHEDR
jgi:SRSO17 transposase